MGVKGVLLPVAYGVASQLSLAGRPFGDALEGEERLAEFKKSQSRRRRAAASRGKVDRTVPAQLRRDLLERDLEICGLRKRLLAVCQENQALKDRNRVLEMKERALLWAEAHELALDAALNRGELTDVCKKDLSDRLAAHFGEDRARRRTQR